MAVKEIHILIVDDSQDYALKLKTAFKELGEVEIAHSEKEFRKVFHPYLFDLILLDLKLKEGKEGLDLLQFIIQEDPSAVVMVISGYGDIATAVEALHKGAKTFLEKDKVPISEIVVRAEHALKENFSERKIRLLEASQEKGEIIGEDSKIQNIRNFIKLVGQDGETTVLIRGATGTGKELVARAIHRMGVRKEGPFVSVALTDVNPETITSELFGHEKGAFSGAVSRHYGFFEQAHKGVLFMDEIGDLPVDIQVKLLRILDQKRFRRMGGKEDIQVDVQVVTATNRPLEEMLREGKFREDLYYRLKVFEIQLPPFRERKGDISILAYHFLALLRSKGRTPALGFSSEAISTLINYYWPGNVRELKSVVENAALRCRLEGTSEIRPFHLASLLMNHHQSSAVEVDVFKSMAETELKLVENALAHSRGKKSEAWKLLKYKNRFTMLRRVQKILRDFPDLAEQFPDVKKSYSQS